MVVFLGSFPVFLSLGISKATSAGGKAGVVWLAAGSSWRLGRSTDRDGIRSCCVLIGIHRPTSRGLATSSVQRSP